MCGIHDAVRSLFHRCSDGLNGTMGRTAFGKLIRMVDSASCEAHRPIEDVNWMFAAADLNEDGELQEEEFLCWAWAGVGSDVLARAAILSDPPDDMDSALLPMFRDIQLSFPFTSGNAIADQLRAAQRGVICEQLAAAAAPPPAAVPSPALLCRVAKTAAAETPGVVACISVCVGMPGGVELLTATLLPEMRQSGAFGPPCCSRSPSQSSSSTPLPPFCGRLGISEISQPSIKDGHGPQRSPRKRVEHADLTFEALLGAGEFGEVYRGRYRGDEVAIKLPFLGDAATSEAALQDLAREVESFRHLSHKRIARFIGCCLELPNPCIVTEYSPGGSLYHLLHVRGVDVPLRHGINLCLQLSDAVRYLHSQSPRIVHRDIKSHNLVLDLQLNLKLCDFGLAEPLPSIAAAAARPLCTPSNGGSPRYMAPELFEADAAISEKVDIWAAGCVFIELLGGVLPYAAIHDLAELKHELRVCRRGPPLPPHVPAALTCVLRACHAFDVDERPEAGRLFELLGEAKLELRRTGAF